MKYIKFLCLILICFFNLYVYAQRISDMPLRDKIGQMLIFGFDGDKVSENSPIVKDIFAYNLGGVILFDYNYQTKTYNKNIKNPQQVKKLINDLQHFTAAANNKVHRPLLSLFVSVDYEGGRVNRLNERYGFSPILSQQKAASAKDLAYKNVNLMAQTLSDMGFNLVFTPVIDVNVNKENPVIGKLERSFSEDPYIVTNFAKIYSKVFREKNIQCVYKHFPGHGSSLNDSHLGFVDVTKTWQEKELIPYKKLINLNNSCNLIMSAHIMHNTLSKEGVPATLSYEILTDLLRKKLNFKGVVITDDMQMKAITDNFKMDDAIIKAINAGADMLIFGNQLTPEYISVGSVINIIETAVNNKKISSARIDQAYERIVSLKKDL